MILSRRALVLGFVALSIAGCGRPEPDIDAASVERIITALSADEMLGRAPFTPGIDKAAAFIRDEFASIGLDVLDDMDDYLQRFTVYRLQVQSRRVVLNGVEIPSERTFVLANAPSVHWTTGDPIEIVVIGSDEDVNQRYQSISDSDRNTLVLMSTSHQARFKGLAAAAPDDFRHMFFLDPPAGATQVWVLTDETRVAPYEVDVMASLEELPLTNVVGMIRGRRDGEIVLFGSYYDSMGIIDPVDGDSIANGANAVSGTAAVIELARFFKAKGRPERTLMFAAFTAHEMGWQGSTYLARKLDPTKIAAMFAISTIGKVDPRGPNTARVEGFDRSDLGRILQQAVEGTAYSFYPSPFPVRLAGRFGRADNREFARRGVPAHAISTMNPVEDKDHQRVSDEIETLDLTNMTEIIRAIALGAGPIISGEATPKRADPPLGKSR
jgi:hypothetical protein